MMSRAWVGSLTVVAVLGLCGVSRADDKADVQAGVKKVADAANYSWTTTVEGGFGAGKTEGMIEKGGYTSYSVNSQNGAYPVLSKGDKTAAKLDSGWMSLAEIQKAA